MSDQSHDGFSDAPVPEPVPTTRVEVAALQSRDGLAGFLFSGRWPHDTSEWGQFLLLAVQVAAMPGMLTASRVFLVLEETPEEPPDDAVGVVIAQGGLVGSDALAPAQFAHPTPPGLVVLHPPGLSATGPVPDGVASGCVLLPGLPHVGLEHRAAWARADRHGHVSEMRTDGAVAVDQDVDTAVLAMLIAA